MIDIYLKKQIFIFIPYNKSYQPFFVVFGDNCQLSVFVLYKPINSFMFIALTLGLPATILLARRAGTLNFITFRYLKMQLNP
jgi:hypothetical protein